MKRGKNRRKVGSATVSPTSSLPRVRHPRSLVRAFQWSFVRGRTSKSADTWRCRRRPPPPPRSFQLKQRARTTSERKVHAFVGGKSERGVVVSLARTLFSSLARGSSTKDDVVAVTITSVNPEFVFSFYFSDAFRTEEIFFRRVLQYQRNAVR